MQSGNCPFPMALSLSTLKATPSTTLPTSGSVDHHDPVLRYGSVLANPVLLPTALDFENPELFVLAISGQTPGGLESCLCASFSPSPSFLFLPLESQAKIQSRLRLWFAPISEAPNTHHRDTGS